MKVGILPSTVRPVNKFAGDSIIGHSPANLSGCLIGGALRILWRRADSDDADADTIREHRNA